MEQNTPKFRLRLNLFDGIVLILVLALGAFLLWSKLKPAAPAGDVPEQVTSTIQYTVRFQRWLEGTGALVQEGDLLADVIKNYELGRVVSAEVVPAEALALDHEERAYVQTTVEGYEDVLVTIESPCTINNDTGAILLGGSYPLRTGAILYIRGEGYMASAPVISMEREELEMKLIDHNGRLFGKISVIDVLVLAVVLVMGAALHFKSNQTHTGTSVTETPITYQVQVNGVRTYVADAVQVGDYMYDQDHSSGGTLGKITSVEVLPGTKMAELMDGSVGLVPAEDSVDLLLTIQGDGLVSEGRYLLNRVYDLGVNSSRNFYTKYTQFTGTVLAIL